MTLVFKGNVVILGKTIPTLTFARYLARRRDSSHFRVVAHQKVLRSAGLDEECVQWWWTCEWGQKFEEWVGAFFEAITERFPHEFMPYHYTYEGEELTAHVCKHCAWKIVASSALGPCLSNLDEYGFQKFIDEWNGTQSKGEV